MSVWDETVQARVERGVALLDKAQPGWERLIDVGELDINECDVCICGQVYGGFGQGIIKLNVETRSDLYGFAPLGFGIVDRKKDGDRLTEEWIRVIKSRFDDGLDLRH
jgi:hypothetical protein